MIQIVGPQFTQWDVGRSVSIDSNATHIHFANQGDSKAVIIQITEGSAKVPDYLFQTGKNLIAYAVLDGVTLESKSFAVRKRERPEDYVYEEDQRNYIYELITSAENATKEASTAAENANQATANANKATAGATVATENANQATANANIAAENANKAAANAAHSAEEAATVATSAVEAAANAATAAAEATETASAAAAAAAENKTALNSKLTKKLLWQNASPSSSFPGNGLTITETILSYDGYEILFSPKPQASGPAQKLLSTGFIPIDRATTLTLFEPPNIYTRAVDMMNLPIVGFGSVQKTTITGSSPTTVSDRLIPQRIYGIKGVS